MRKLAPLEVFQKTVEYFPTVSVNILLRNDKGEFLFVKRKTEPAKGYFWVPGGRVLNGETIEKAAQLILEQETGLKGKLLYRSPLYFEEIFEVKDFEERDEKLYPAQIQKVHYLATAVLMELNNGEEVSLDGTSDGYLWAKEPPKPHPYLDRYFEAINHLSSQKSF